MNFYMTSSHSLVIISLPLTCCDVEECSEFNGLICGSAVASRPEPHKNAIVTMSALLNKVKYDRPFRGNIIISSMRCDIKMTFA